MEGKEDKGKSTISRARPEEEEKKKPAEAKRFSHTMKEWGKEDGSFPQLFGGKDVKSDQRRAMLPICPDK